MNVPDERGLKLRAGISDTLHGFLGGEMNAPDERGLKPVERELEDLADGRAR